MSAYAAADQPAIYSEEGRALKKRIELKKKLEQRRADASAAAIGEDRRRRGKKARPRRLSWPSGSAPIERKLLPQRERGKRTSKKKQTFAQFRWESLDRLN